MIFIKLKTINYQYDKELSIILKILNNKLQLTSKIVGGAIRDNILGIINQDIDIVTILKPKEVIKKLINNNIKIKISGIEYGTIIVILNKIQLQITTLRKDITIPNNKNYVYFIKNWKEDLYRRDFTLNTLYSDIYGNTYDLLNNAINHLQNKQIKLIGNKNIKINEDVLRILRFYRFYKLYNRDIILQLYNIKIKKLSIKYENKIKKTFNKFYFILKLIKNILLNQKILFFNKSIKIKTCEYNNKIIQQLYYKNNKITLLYILIYSIKYKKYF